MLQHKLQIFGQLVFDKKNLKYFFICKNSKHPYIVVQPYPRGSWPIGLKKNSLYSYVKKMTHPQFVAKPYPRES